MLLRCYSQIQNPQGLTDNSDDNFYIRTWSEKELKKLTLFIFFKRKLEIRKETG